MRWVAVMIVLMSTVIGVELGLVAYVHRECPWIMTPPTSAKFSLRTRIRVCVEVIGDHR